MATPTESQRLAAVRKLTSELYVLQDRMNQTIDQITGLLHGAELGALVPVASRPERSADGALERSMTPSALALPLAQVFVNNPANASSIGDDCKLFCDYKHGALQMVQVPAARGSDSRYAVVLNYANFDAGFLSLVFDARALLRDMPAGKLRIGLALEIRAEPAVKLHCKVAYRVGSEWGELKLAPKGGRVLVDTVEVPLIDLSLVEALDFHLIFTPLARGCIELHRANFSLGVEPVTESAAANVFEGEV